MVGELPTSSRLLHWYPGVRGKEGGGHNLLYTKILSGLGVVEFLEKTRTGIAESRFRSNPNLKGVTTEIGNV